MEYEVSADRTGVRAMAGVDMAAANRATAPLAALSALLSPHDDIFGKPEEFAVRAGLTALALLLALTLGPRLATQVSTAPAPAHGEGEGEAEVERGGRRPRARILERRGAWGKWLGSVTLASIWLAALGAVVVVWLWGRSGFLPDSSRVILTQVGYIVTRVAVSLLVLAVTLALARALETGMELGLARGRVNKNLIVLAGHAIYVATVIVGLVVMLTVWDVSLVVPVTLIGVVTVALGIALQDILKNVVAGVYLLIERPFVIGDQISVPPYTGVIEDILIRVTRLRTADGQLVLIPNGTLFTSPVVNKSFYERRRVGLALTLPESGSQNTPSGADSVETAQAQILAVLEAVPGVRADPAPEVTVRGSAVGKVELRATFWVPTGDPPRERAIISDAIEQLRLRLPEAEIAASASGSTPVPV